MSVSKWSHSVSQPDLATLLVMAFRYALGRRSTAPSTVADFLRAYGHVLESWQKEQICKDIEGAIAGNMAGDTCDVQTWREVQERLKPVKEGPTCPICGKEITSAQSRVTSMVGEWPRTIHRTCDASPTRESTKEKT